MAAQGAVLVFLFIIVIYCVAMDYFERKQARMDAAKAAALSVSATDSHA